MLLVPLPFALLIAREDLLTLPVLHLELILGALDCPLEARLVLAREGLARLPQVGLRLRVGKGMGVRVVGLCWACGEEGGRVVPRNATPPCAVLRYSLGGVGGGPRAHNSLRTAISPYETIRERAEPHGGGSC